MTYADAAASWEAERERACAEAGFTVDDMTYAAWAVRAVTEDAMEVCDECGLRHGGAAPCRVCPGCEEWPCTCEIKDEEDAA